MVHRAHAGRQNSGIRRDWLTSSLRANSPPIAPHYDSHLTAHSANFTHRQLISTTSRIRASRPEEASHAATMSAMVNGHMRQSERIAHTEEKHLPGGWVVLKFGGTSVGRFAENIAGIVR
jgi:hypothetical protein